MDRDFVQTQDGHSAKELLRELRAARQELDLVREQNERLRIPAQSAQERRAVQELVARDQAILASMSDGLVIFDLAGNLLELNPAALRLHGFESVESVRRHVQELGPLFDLRDLEGNLLPVESWPQSRVLRGETFVDLELGVRNLVTGAASVWSYNGTPVRDEEGKVTLGILTIRDVTRHKEIAAGVHRQYVFLERLIAEAPVGIAVISGADHRFELANSCFCALPGLPDQQILGRTVAESFPQAVDQGVLSLVEEAYRTGETVSRRRYEALVGPGRGRTFWNGELVPLIGPNGQVERLLVIAHDVTPEVLAHERIEELAVRFQRQAEELDTVLESMVENVVVYDCADRLLRANRAARESYGAALDGQSQGEIIRRLNLRTVDGRPITPEESPVNRALRGEVVQGDRYRFAHVRDGDRIMSASAAPLFEGDRTVGAVVVWHDITDQVRAESEREAALQAARESEEKLQTLVRILPLDITVFDAGGRVTCLSPGDNGTIELPGVALQTGTYRQDVYVRPDGSPLPLHEFPVLRALREGEVIRSVEFGAVQEGGEVAWVNVSAAPLPFRDWRAIAATVDVTEQMRARRALEQRNRELQELTAELEAYDHTVAHDLNNSLSLIVGSADLLGGGLGDLEGEGRQMMLNNIVHGSLRLKEIVDSLLLLASSRSKEARIERVDMGPIVARARQEVAPLAERNGAQIASPERWPAARGYAPWLQSVWANCLSNAVKYGGDPPQIELGAEEQGDGMVRFWVRDSGPGLTAEQQAGLFVKFSRLDRPEQLGHGLGLTIVRRIVERLGGQVGVESRAGEGSTFWFTLPAV